MSHPRDARGLDAGLPDRRLPDAGLALDHERRQPASPTVKKRRDGSELVPPHDDLVRHADLPLPSLPQPADADATPIAWNGPAPGDVED